MLSLFSERVTVEEKEAIRSELLATPRDAVLEAESVVVLDEATELADLVGESSWLLFDVTSSPHEWLEKLPEHWSEDDHYNELKNLILSMKVTNDVAERGIALLKDFVAK